MRKSILIACLVLVPLLTGCSIVPNLLFAIFGDGYTGGGDTRAEREYHFNQQVQGSDHYQPWHE